jgi:hypothetical protein
LPKELLLTAKVSRLNQFLELRDIQLYERDRFVRSTSRKNPLVQVDYSLFLDQNHRFKTPLFELIKEIIRQSKLKIYFVMVSWWGRGDQALWTGSHLLNTLLRFEKEGLCKIFLSYQEGDYGPSSLCNWCKRRKIEVLFVDHYQLVSKHEKEVIIPRKVPGKAENVIKSLKLIEQKVREKRYSPKKVLVIFVDDDYTQYHWINYFMLFAPWVLSFQKRTKDKEIDQIIGKISRVSFIKSGCPRIILPYELQGQIVDGRLKPMDYLDVTLSILDLDAVQKRLGLGIEKEEVSELFSILKEIKAKKQIFSPQNRIYFLGEKLNDRLESVWCEYIYRGGRVTQRLEGIFRYLSHKSHCRWLRQFTFLLHGDQGAPLNAWLEYSPFGGYALEISLLLQAICDKAFEEHQVLNITGLPHSHQRSKDLAIWHMLDSILLAFDLTRVLYKDLSLRNFLSVYGYKRHFPMLDRFGNIIQHHPKYGGLKIYPPLKNLDIDS